VLVPDILRTAIRQRRCVSIAVDGLRRKVCPHAIGFKDNRVKLLAFQYSGESASGLPIGGGWRVFNLDDVHSAEFLDGPWHSEHDYVIKLETSFEFVRCSVSPRLHAVLRNDCGC
jgi:predicted DNA-binding transcriptional regulator YafY